MPMVYCHCGSRLSVTTFVRAPVSWLERNVLGVDIMIGDGKRRLPARLSYHANVNPPQRRKVRGFPKDIKWREDKQARRRSEADFLFLSTELNTVF